MTGPVLVTGAAGFIGITLCKLLISQGERVIALDKLSYASSPQALDPLRRTGRLELVQADVADERAVHALLLRHQVAGVVHLAAETHVDRSIDRPLDFVQANLLGTAVLLEAVRRYLLGGSASERAGFRFVHVSTDEVYGALTTNEAPFTPDRAYAPSSPYSATKAGADHLVQAWHRTYGLPCLVSNCANNYGPWQFPEKLIPVTIARALAERPVLVYGQGDQVRDWIHVEDHAAALLLLLRAGRAGAAYLVGARCERSNVDVVSATLDALDGLRPRPDRRPRRDLIRFSKDRPGHDRRYAVDPCLMESELGWRPRVPFDGGLSRTVAWYLDNEDWWRGLPGGAGTGPRQGLPR